MTLSSQALRRFFTAGREPPIFREVRREHDDATRKHQDLEQKISNLENLIVSVPAVIERRRIRFRDMLPPPDTGAAASSASTPHSSDASPPKRLSRRQRHLLRIRRIRNLLVFATLLTAALAVTAGVYYVFVTRI